MDEEDIARIFANPFYCLNANKTFCEKHDVIISEDEWIKVGIKLINEIGAENYLRHLIENLKGNYIK